MRNTRTTRILLALALLGIPLLGAVDAGADARVTAAVGSVVGAEDRPLEQRAALGEGEALRTEEDGNCAVLLEEDALLELCGDTNLRLERRDKTRVVHLDAGEIKVVAEPRLGEERVEIHTPAAIATILGTVVHVEVNEADGSMRFSVGETGDSKVGVVTKGDNKKYELGDGDELVIQEDGTARRQKLGPRQLAALGGCLVDLHRAALEGDVRRHGDRAVETAAAVEIASTSLDPVALGLGSGPTIGDPGDSLAGQGEGVCVVTDCSRILVPEGPFELPGCGPGAEGKQCQ